MTEKVGIDSNEIKDIAEKTLNELHEKIDKKFPKEKEKYKFMLFLATIKFMCIEMEKLGLDYGVSFEKILDGGIE